MKKVPPEQDKIAKIVLAYRPKRKTKKISGKVIVAAKPTKLT